MCDVEGCVCNCDAASMDHAADALRGALVDLLSTFRRCSYHGGGKGARGVFGLDTEEDRIATWNTSSGDREYCDACHFAMIAGGRNAYHFTEEPYAEQVRAALRALEES